MTPSNDEKARDEARQDEGAASVKENQKLEHSVDGSTTRDDRNDAGVSMLAGDPDEPVGPEDAFGEGDKRGDYSERTGGGVHLEAVPLPDGGAPVYADPETGKTYDEQNADGSRVVVDYKPRSELVAQTPRASEQGEVAGKKGGVETAEA